MSKTLSQDNFSGSAVGLYRMSKVARHIFNLQKRFSMTLGKILVLCPIPYLKSKEAFYASNYCDYLWFDVDNEEDFNRAQKVIPELYSQFQT